jgi:tRNA nucleotidyltransferase (CCA-adding enzyme)
MTQKATLSSGARLRLPKSLVKMLEPLTRLAAQAGAPIYLVGGGVRDLLLGREALDIDVVLEGPTDAFAKAAAKACKAKLVSHDAFLTHTLAFADGRHLDIATARTEGYPEPASLPVVEPASLQDDLYRRDFSINAIALSLNELDFGHIWDAFGGVEDLRDKKIRVLHALSFRDDPTRIFRAARFAGRFGYSLDWRTREWLIESVAGQGPGLLSGARLREEIIPILLEDDPRPALALLQEWNVLGYIAQGLRWERSHEQLFNQALKAERRYDALTLRLAVLLHTVPVSKAVGALGHLMFPQKMIQQVEQSLTLLARLREGGVTPSELNGRKSVIPPEVKWFVDHAIKVKTLAPKRQAVDQWERLHESTPCLTGRDIEEMGYRPGPLYGRILTALRQARWEGKLRTREEEVRFIREVFPQHAR